MEVSESVNSVTCLKCIQPLRTCYEAMYSCLLIITLSIINDGTHM